LLCCARQVGKTTAVSALALWTSLYVPGSLTILISPSLRQSTLLYRRVGEFWRALGKPYGSVEENATSLILGNGSSLVSLPNSPDTVRGYAGARLVVVDEAAMVDDELFAVVSPMVSVSRGRLVALSTPRGRRGTFHDAWHDTGDTWERIRVTAWESPLHDPAFLERERRVLGKRAFMQEYECVFNDMIGAVFDTDTILNAFRSDKPPFPLPVPMESAR
jgi:hypothetical protein